MNITIFGGTKPRPGEPAYEEAIRLGARLAEAGHTIITGGYMGTMEAASQGANQAGGEVVGITCQEIEDWRGGKANAWVTIEQKVNTLQERMILLMDSADAILALPGGIGTLAEISLLWNRMVIESSPRKPLVLIGAGWREAVATLSSALDGYFPPSHIEMLNFAGSIEDAVRMVETFSPSRA
jgi:uncharacterized protein (TIGR00725 family)